MAQRILPQSWQTQPSGALLSLVDILEPPQSGQIVFPPFVIVLGPFLVITVSVSFTIYGHPIISPLTFLGQGSAFRSEKMGGLANPFD